MRTAVVLPAPLWPSSPSTVPGATRQVQPAQRLGLAEALAQVLGEDRRFRTLYVIVRRTIGVHCTNVKGAQGRRSGRGLSRAAAGRGRRCRASRSSQTALRIADEEGLEAVSIRRIARELRSGRDVALPLLRLRDELLDLMGDTVAARDARARAARALARRAAARSPRHSRAMFLNHPWMLVTLQERPRVSPNLLRHIEQSAQSVAELGGQGPAGAAGCDRDRGRRLHDRLHVARARGGHARTSAGARSRRASPTPSTTRTSAICSRAASSRCSRQFIGGGGSRGRCRTSRSGWSGCWTASRPR